MSRDEIIRMAREAGFEFKDRAEPKLERFFHAAYAAGAAAEREACAKVCDPEPSLPNEAYTVLNNKATMRRCAAGIRARGQQ